MYFTAYLIHYFYNLKAKYDQKKKKDFRIGLYTKKTYIEKRLTSLYVYKVK